ncbi:MAG: hypothetical protein PQJ50_15765 [Spirochaetales bacterium]|nr:hypothetical protein [Spirochaetales bacterium]
MNLLTMAVGLLPCAYALYVLVLRVQGKDERFRKLGPIKEKFGEKTGSIIHLLAYGALPFIFGISVIAAGVAGLSITDFI